jgi:cellulose biosynthesis protein BcsQ
MVDTDPQGQIAPMLGLRPEGGTLADLFLKDYQPESCITPVRERMDLIRSDRHTVRAEAALMQTPARERAFRPLFETFDRSYDVVIVDTAPSISMMQTCALVYAQRFLIPVTMDDLAIQGTVASIHTAQLMNGIYTGTDIRPVALLPVQVDRRWKSCTAPRPPYRTSPSSTASRSCRRSAPIRQSSGPQPCGVSSPTRCRSRARLTKITNKQPRNWRSYSMLMR